MDAPLTSPFFAVSNGLAGEKSPYLRQHAQNPVQWLPWGNEAFERARSQNKPIFLSIGYSTCHWCHVMARESFENPQIAALMNELFVNVKVDREERPDVDRVYMAFVQATTGSGGWPMSVWLTPDLKPIFGGTYFPPADRYGRRGFPAVCRALAEAWRTDRDKLSAQSERVIEALRDAGANDREPSVVGDLPRVDAVLWREALGPYLDGFDTEWGGFGGSPKFPRPVVLQLLARIVYRLERAGARQEADQARDALLLTLDKMAAGGIHDHLGGGFSRYSVDRYWHVPHFEKMLYDQAQLVFAYLEAYQLTRHETYRSVVYDILGYVQRDLTSEAGGFFSAEDADSSVSFEHPAEHAEGAFYVWSAAEINAALTAEESVTFCRIYGVDQEGNCPPESDPHGEFRGKNVLIQRESIPSADAPVIDAARRKLLAARAGRPRPHLDDKVLAAWNGLMISAYARAYRIFDEPSFLQSAQRAASFIRTEMFSETSGVLRRSFREGPAKVDGFADDYAFLIQGLLDLYEADFDLEHLLWARRLQQTQDALFFDRENGGYYGAVAAPSVSASSEPSLPLRLKEDHDGAEPSSSSVSAVNLGRLSAVLGDVTLRAQALQTVATFVRADRQDEAPTISRLAQTLPAMLTAWDVLAQEPERIVIAGSIDEPRTALFSKAASQPYAPGRVLMLADGGRGQELLAVGAPYLAAISLIDGKPAAYRCADGTCQLPTTNPADLSAPQCAQATLNSRAMNSRMPSRIQTTGF